MSPRVFEADGLADVKTTEIYTYVLGHNTDKVQIFVWLVSRNIFKLFIVIDRKIRKNGANIFPKYRHLHS